MNLEIGGNLLTMAVIIVVAWLVERWWHYRAQGRR